MPMLTRHTRGYLPHVDAPEGTYFLTFRLHDSLPAKALAEFRTELRLRKFQQKQNLHSTYHWDDEYFRRIEGYLDESAGNCWLGQPKIASLVSNALRYFDNERYILHTWTIMPNHVHVLFTLLKDFHLSSIAHSWKSFTAKEANRILGRSGSFWQRESFDRLIRSDRQMEFTIRYILNNPVKAGLCKEMFQWPWSGCSAEIQDIARKFFWSNAGEDACAP